MDHTSKHAKFSVDGFSTFGDMTSHFFPKWNESSRFDIYLLHSRKTPQKSLFMPENIFPGINLYSLYISMVLKRNKKLCMLNFSRCLISETTAATPLVN